MPTKTENEKKAPDLPAGVAMTRTDTRMQMREIALSDKGTIGPESLVRFLDEGYETQKHVKLTEGTYLRGIFAGMEDGELSARPSGETPSVKWVYVKVSDLETVRLLGAYNMISQLQRVPVGAAVVIARGSDYELPNHFRCTEYFVYWKKPTDGAQKTTEVVVEGQRV